MFVSKIRSIRKYRHYIAAIVAALGVVLTLYFGTSELYRLNDPAAKSLARVIIGLVVTVLVTALAFMLDITFTFEEVHDKLDDVVDARYMGLANQILARVVDRFENAQEIHNTFIFFGVSDLVASSYDEAQRHQVSEGIKNFVGSGRVWNEIVSQDVVNSKDLNWLHFLTDLEGKEKQKARECFHVRRLMESYPVINFMILRYGDDDKEVIFGWGHHSADANSHVFMSRNQRLIETFEAYWNILHEDSIEFQPHAVEQRPIAPTDVAGLWFRVAYSAPAEWTPSAGIPPSVDVKDVALVVIGVEQHRRITIEGRKFPTDKIEPVEVFHSKAADLKEHILWFATSYGFQEELHSAGSYQFVPPKKKDEKQDFEIEDFFGGVVDLAQSPTARIANDGKALEQGSSTLRETKPTEPLEKPNLVVFGTRVNRDNTGALRLKPTGEKKEGFTVAMNFPDDPKDQADFLERWRDEWKMAGKDRWEFSKTSGQAAGQVGPKGQKT